MELLQNTSSDRLVEHIAHVLPILGDQSAVAVLLETCRGDYDGFLKVTLARAILELKDPSGFPVPINILGSGDEPELARQEAIELLRNFRGKEFRYGPDRDLTENGKPSNGGVYGGQSAVLISSGGSRHVGSSDPISAASMGLPF